MTEKKIKIRNNQVEINYYQEGQGDMSLLFIHGWCINGSYWEDQISYFTKTNAVYAIDLPGFGKSSAERDVWSVEEYAKDITAFIQALDLKNVVLIGHSMSGYSILQASLDDASRIIGLVGIDNYKSFYLHMTPEQTEQKTAFFASLREDFQNFAPAYAANMLLHEDTAAAVKERIRQDYSLANPVIAYDTLFRMMQFVPTVPAKLGKAPYTLHLINNDTTPTDETELAKYCKKGYLLKTIHGTGHYPMNEKPAEFNLLLEDVLKEIVDLELSANRVKSV